MVISGHPRSSACLREAVGVRRKASDDRLHPALRLLDETGARDGARHGPAPHANGAIARAAEQSTVRQHANGEHGLLVEQRRGGRGRSSGERMPDPDGLIPAAGAQRAARIAAFSRQACHHLMREAINESINAIIPPPSLARHVTTCLFETSFPDEGGNQRINQRHYTCLFETSFPGGSP